MRRIINETWNACARGGLGPCGLGLGSCSSPYFLCEINPVLGIREKCNNTIQLEKLEGWFGVKRK